MCTCVVHIALCTNCQSCAHSAVCVLCSAHCPVYPTQVYWSTIFEVYWLWGAQYLPPVGPVHISSWGIFVRWVRQLNHLQFWRKRFENCQLLKGGAFVFANRNPKTFTHVAEVEVGRQIFAHVITCGSFCIHPETTDCKKLGVLIGLLINPLTRTSNTKIVLSAFVSLHLYTIPVLSS